MYTLQGFQIGHSAIHSFLSLLIFVNTCQVRYFTMVTQFGERIRALRIKQGLLLRQIASVMEMDTALLSKIERGERPIKREQIHMLAQALKADKEELLTLFLADQVMEVLKDEKLADEALKSVSKKIKKAK